MNSFDTKAYLVRAVEDNPRAELSITRGNVWSINGRTVTITEDGTLTNSKIAQRVTDYQDVSHFVSTMAR